MRAATTTERVVAVFNAGVQVGDVIYRYDGERVYDPSTFYVRTTQGERGADVPVEVLRDNEIVPLSVPRGPFGGKLEHFSALPR